jgi:DNA-directed RNA polymerase specialized sigma24 family protein
MNQHEPGTFTVSVKGELTLSKDELREILTEAMSKISPQPPAIIKSDEGPPRLAFTLKETAALLGISYATAFRLVQRGLLKSSHALRCKIISKSEIERFLRDTSKSI